MTPVSLHFYSCRGASLHDRLLLLLLSAWYVCQEEALSDTLQSVG